MMTYQSSSFWHGEKAPCESLSTTAKYLKYSHPLEHQEQQQQQQEHQEQQLLPAAMKLTAPTSLLLFLSDWVLYQTRVSVAKWLHKHDIPSSESIASMYTGSFHSNLPSITHLLAEAMPFSGVPTDPYYSFQGTYFTHWNIMLCFITSTNFESKSSL